MQPRPRSTRHSRQGVRRLANRRTGSLTLALRPARGGNAVSLGSIRSVLRWRRVCRLGPAKPSACNHRPHRGLPQACRSARPRDTAGAPCRAGVPPATQDCSPISRRGFMAPTAPGGGRSPGGSPTATRPSGSESNAWTGSVWSCGIATSRAIASTTMAAERGRPGELHVSRPTPEVTSCSHTRSMPQSRYAAPASAGTRASSR